MPVTLPLLSTVAALPLEELHVPPGVVLVNSTVLPAHILEVPEISATIGLLVTVILNGPDAVLPQVLVTV